MTERSSPGPDDYMYDLAMFLLTSARGCLDEPPIYGPLRLMQALSRLATTSRHMPCVSADEFLLAARKKIDQNEHIAFESEEEFTKFLDSMIREFTAELKRRNRTQ
jgi:uncharacterized protein DUF6092